MGFTSPCCTKYFACLSNTIIKLPMPLMELVYHVLEAPARVASRAFSQFLLGANVPDLAALIFALMSIINRPVCTVNWTKGVHNHQVWIDLIYNRCVNSSCLSTPKFELGGGTSRRKTSFLPLSLPIAFSPIQDFFVWHERLLRAYWRVCSRAYSIPVLFKCHPSGELLGVWLL